MDNKKITLVAQSKNYDVSNKSSSGGMFAELARYVLSKDGVVFGCAMERIEEGFDVKHIYIENEKDLYKLQGSKYVQSNLGNTIKQAKEFLEQGRFVLFSGTPCQIAGLKAYLKQDYENLLTVDLSCTGTPSLEIFNAYIIFLENKYKQKIINFEFRNKKRMGWSCGNAIITFKDGKKKVLYNNISSYLNLFITKRLQKPSCQNCKFSGLNRVSDITIADAWGVDIEYPERLKTKFHKNNGISLILVNTNKGLQHLEVVKNNLIFEKININKFLKYNNPLTNSKKTIETEYLDEYKTNGYEGLEKLFKKELGYKYYYYKIKNHTPKWIKNIVKLFMRKERKVDVLIQTWFTWQNYGSILTAYALYKSITDLGYNACLIRVGKFLAFSKDFNRKYTQYTSECLTAKDFYKLNKLTDTFVLGSDNQINYDIINFYYICRNLFNYTDLNKKRLMISGSVGNWNGQTKTEAEKKYITKLLQRFDYLSTRENHSKNILEQEFGLNADWINDPVFYLKKEDYINLTKGVKEDYSGKIMQYILYPNKDTNEIIKYLCDKERTSTVCFNAEENVSLKDVKKNKSVENWLKAILESKIVITDSFHCTCFSLIFNKTVVCLSNSHNPIRFISLFERLGIDLPIIKSLNDLKNASLDYDKKEINKSFEDIRQNAIDILYRELSKPKTQLTEIDIQKETEFQNYNKQFIINNSIWYQRNKIFYYLIIRIFISPLKRFIQRIKK